jgi:hypothetical protein
MIPLGDSIRPRRRPVACIALLLAMAACWVFVQGAGLNDQVLAASVCNLGMVAGELTHQAHLGTAVPIGPVYPSARIRMLFIVLIVRVPAWLVLLYWFGLQVVAALPQLADAQQAVESGVAVMAHVAGFITGIILVRAFVRWPHGRRQQGWL